MFAQDQLLEVMKKRVPNFKIAFKDQSKLMKIIGAIFFFNKSFMTDMTTTIGTTIYFPNKEHYEDNWQVVLPHEYIHMADYDKNKISFVLSYLCPQLYALLSLFAISAIWNIWFLLFLLCLIFLLPIPSKGRTWIEKRGYTVSTYIEYKILGKILPGTQEYLVDIFSGMAYYHMNTNKGAVKTATEIVSDAINANLTNTTGAFRDIIVLCNK